MEDRLRGRLCYEFGGFRLDPNRRVIQAPTGGRRIDVPPRIFDAALYFVRHAGRLIPKERLLAELWPGSDVEENNLAQVVSILRRALGESRGENRFIVTVPRLGYRFVASVAQVVDSAEADTSTEVVTVAVLPFEVWSQDDGDRRLAQGIAECIRHRLSGISGLRLLARAPSASGAEGRDEPRPEPHYRVEGSLQRNGRSLRVTAKLVDCTDGTLLWSRVLDRGSDDIFALEDDVARRVASALRRR